MHLLFRLCHSLFAGSHLSSRLLLQLDLRASPVHKQVAAHCLSSISRSRASKVYSYSQHASHILTAVTLSYAPKPKLDSVNSIISTTISILLQVAVTLRDTYFRFRSMYIVIFKRSTLLASTSSKPKYISEHLLLRGFLWEPSMYSEKALDSFASLHSYRTKTHVPLAARSTLFQHCSKDSTNKLRQSLTLWFTFNTLWLLFGSCSYIKPRSLWTFLTCDRMLFDGSWMIRSSLLLRLSCLTFDSVLIGAVGIGFCYVGWSYAK